MPLQALGIVRVIHFDGGLFLEHYRFRKFYPGSLRSAFGSPRDRNALVISYGKPFVQTCSTLPFLESAAYAESGGYACNVDSRDRQLRNPVRIEDTVLVRISQKPVGKFIRHPDIHDARDSAGFRSLFLRRRPDRRASFHHIVHAAAGQKGGESKRPDQSIFLHNDILNLLIGVEPDLLFLDHCERELRNLRECGPSAAVDLRHELHFGRIERSAAGSRKA